ncbi:MAG: UDP-N-acetylglucosamine 1-carboxyvinyltransferase [Acutalibacteraceae bacterium]|nr:UDP-N-acetylglucosamine 1-carboxyvinyltransferase [Acutalibacteraceae bacterium]
MGVFKVKGGKKLSGSLTVQGAKNSALPILAATLLIKDKSVLHNCPDLTDTSAALKILVMLGCVCVRDDNTVIVDARDAVNFEISKELMREMRSSVVFLGAMISRMGRAVISNPGGCELGPRPIDLHISALRQLGVHIEEQEDRIVCTAPKGIIGSEITLDFPSVGATENIIIAACVSKGTTVIKNAAREPEISDLADFLNRAGGRIKGAGSSVVTIEGVGRLYSAEHRVLPDRIVAATYLSAAAVTGGEVMLKGCNAVNMMSILRFFGDIGCRIKSDGSNIYLCGKEKYNPTRQIVTDVYPAFPTDAGPIVVPVFCRIDGRQSIKETIFENRFRYINELNKLGADISLKGDVAATNGLKILKATNVRCTDLRGGAALVVAALCCEGEVLISDIHHIERGYCNMPRCLNALGADITEV